MVNEINMRSATRMQLMNALQVAGVAFDEESTLVQLRALYDAMPQRPVEPEEQQRPVEPEEQQRPVEPEEQQRPVEPKEQQPDGAQDVQQEIKQHRIDYGSDSRTGSQSGGSAAADYLATINLGVEEVMLDRQLAIARKKKELLSLQAEINQAECRRIDLGVLDAMVSKFEGTDVQDVHKWINDLENVFQIFDYNERDKLVATRHLLVGHAKRFAEVMASRTYAQLRKQLIGEFERTYTVRDVLKQLKMRKIKPDETTRAYVIEMQFIASRANITESDLIDLIVDGLNDRSMYAASLYSAYSLEQLKKMLEKYEKRRVVVPSTATTRSTTAAPAVATSRVRGVGTPSGVRDMTEVRCYNCFQYGHYQGACTAARRPPNSCFICREVGHTRHQCPNRGRQSRPLIPMVAALEETLDPVNNNNMVSVAFLNQAGYTDLVLCYALFDTGSPVSFVQMSCVPIKINRCQMPTSFRGVGNKKISCFGIVRCKINFQSQEIVHNLFVLPDDEAVVPLLIGRDVLKKLNVSLYQLKHVKYDKEQMLNFDRKDYQMPAEVISVLKQLDIFVDPTIELNNELPIVLNNELLIELNNELPTEPNNKSDVKEIENDIVTVDPEYNIVRDLQKCEKRIESMIGVVDFTSLKDLVGYDEIIMCIDDNNTEVTEERIDINANLSKDEFDILKTVVTDCYLTMNGERRKYNSYCMKITLKSETPVFSSPRRLSYREKAEVQKTIDELLSQGIIRPSSSPYASPIVLVRKKNGNLRMCIDYRALNKLTVRDHFPLPLIEDCLEYLGGKRIFSTIDLKNGFHQVPMHEDSIALTAFVTPMGQYEYCYMPFGLTNAPAVFQRFINLVLRSLIDKRKIVVYLDDINIATVTMKEHVELLAEVLKLLSEAGLRVNLGKCKFGYGELEYLGYRISERGIQPNEEHLKAIRNYAVPTNTRELQRAIGLFSYFRRFVYNFSHIARPLNQLMKKDAKFEWTESCTNAFEMLKNMLIKPPILSIFDPSRETELHTDASSHGYGAVLLQKQEDNKFHPVAFYSKTTTDAESRYHSFELETLAIVNALERFRTFLDGIPFVIVTDCNSLVLTLERKMINPRIARWTLAFADFDFTVRHRKGEQMQHVDALSRTPVICAVEENEVDLNIQVTQMRDPVIKELRERLENEEVPGYELENGLVFRDGGNYKQLVVPQEMEENVIRQVHENYGHLGIEKCSYQIKKNYWFPLMRDKVDRFIKNCLRCIYYSTSPRSNERNLYNIPKKAEAFDTIHIDHFGPLEVVNSKHKHILVVIDSFTKFVKLYAVNTSSKETICTLEKYFANYSRPRRIISDRGTCFTSKEFETFCKKNNVAHVLNAVASPQSNGQVERVNRVLKAILAKITETIDHTDWKEKLAEVEFALNNTVHCATKQTPSILLFGVEQRGPNVDELTEYLQGFYSKGQEGLREIREKAVIAIQKSQVINQKYFEQKHKPAKEFQVGDLVVIKNNDITVGKNRKLIPKYKGPYVIAKKLDHDRYVVKDVENCQVTQLPYNSVIDSSRIRKWLDPDKCKQVENKEGNTYANTDDDDCINYEFLDDNDCVNYEFLGD